MICICLIIVVLMQSAKGEGLAGAFGGGGITGAVFGGRGAATFLSKATTYIAIAFMVSCLGLTFISPGSRAGRRESAIRKEMEQGGGQLPLDQPIPAPPAEGVEGEQPAAGGDAGGSPEQEGQ